MLVHTLLVNSRNGLAHDVFNTFCSACLPGLWGFPMSRFRLSNVVMNKQDQKSGEKLLCIFLSFFNLFLM